ncbi:MAM domain-containing protein 2a [Sinocyclocheilus rhinocerous]|uniref:MAM domain-containing protein 2a n=1 Tax=Sinocyclocheilus rhinocerous TaxID=307959 RepID=UPI0007BA9306|nr:PREDICTED: MAM domain-containing protein 2-like [Sinocyclocheilus rhinocerous]
MSVLHFSSLLAVALLARAQTQLLRGSCSFETDSCGYTSDPTFAAWTINAEGRFITADSSYFGENKKYVLVSPELELRDWSCVRLVYQISGSGSLQLHLRPEGENFDYTLWTAEKPSDSWLIASVDLRNMTGAYQLLFEAKPSRAMGNSVALFEIHIIPGYCLGKSSLLYLGYNVVFEVAFNSPRGGYVALDDISFSPEFCHTETEPAFDPSVANCDFEEGLCQYYQEQTGGSVWNRVSVKPNVYRISDHTTGTGSFLLANTRYTSRPGYVGRLFGPSLPGNHKYCLRFYYALHGFMKIDNALALYVYDEKNIAQEKIWTVSERSKDVWTEVEVTYLKPMPTKVSFVSICRNFWDCGLVSLDDISVTLGDCRVTTGPLNPPPGHCSFETGDCGYTQKKKAKKGHWLRIRGQTPTSYTGPKGDHTLGVGYYMYIEASHMLPKQSTGLMSTELRGSTGPHCLIFFYHMYGSGTGTLNVLLHKVDRERLLWTRQGEQSVSWMKATVDYECYTRHWIIFEAVRGSSIRSDIAIDDVVFKKGPCKDPGDSIPYSGFSENVNEIEY